MRAVVLPFRQSAQCMCGDFDKNCFLHSSEKLAASFCLTELSSTMASVSNISAHLLSRAYENTSMGKSSTTVQGWKMQVKMVQVKSSTITHRLY